MLFWGPPICSSGPNQQSYLGAITLNCATSHNYLLNTNNVLLSELRLGGLDHGYLLAWILFHHCVILDYNSAADDAPREAPRAMYCIPLELYNVDNQEIALKTANKPLCFAHSLALTFDPDFWEA